MPDCDASVSCIAFKPSSVPMVVRASFGGQRLSSLRLAIAIIDTQKSFPAMRTIHTERRVFDLSVRARFSTVLVTPRKCDK
jgi:hypothetical protein